MTAYNTDFYFDELHGPDLLVDTMDGGKNKSKPELSYDSSYTKSDESKDIKLEVNTTPARAGFSATNRDTKLART